MDNVVRKEFRRNLTDLIKSVMVDKRITVKDLSRRLSKSELLVQKILDGANFEVNTLADIMEALDYNMFSTKIQCVNLDVLAYIGFQCENGNGCGVSVVYGDSRNVFTINCRNTTYSRIQLLTAIEVLKRYAYPGRAITIRSGSHYLNSVLELYRNKWSKNNWTKNDGTKVINQDLIKDLDRLASKYSKVTFQLSVYNDQDHKYCKEKAKKDINFPTVVNDNDDM